MAGLPGCKSCGQRTASGGVPYVLELDGTERFEVRLAGVPLQRFRSAVAAATFSRGTVGATVHLVDLTADPPVEAV